MNTTVSTCPTDFRVYGANRIFVRSNAFNSSDDNSWVKIANEASWDRSEEMKSGCFRVSAKSKCVSTYILWHNYKPKGNEHVTVIGNKIVYTNSDFRGGIKCHQTNWTYLLSGSDEFYFDKPTLILASNIECLQLAMLLNSALWRIWNVQSKTRATVQDSCFWLQLMKWHDNVSTKQQIGWFHFEWQQHLRCTSCSNEAASFSFWFWRVNES